MKGQKLYSGMAIIVWVVVSFLWVPGCKESKSADLAEALKALPGAAVKSVKAEAPFKEVFEIKLTQPLNHRDPGGETLEQQLILSHVDTAKPMVLIIEGYGIGHNFIRELSESLDANQLRVEHRFFGESKPQTMKWQYLNLEQAADDYHRIVTLFKKIYRGPWVSTGWSKGGQAALIFRSYYPGDVTATVAYDTPLNFAIEDPRIDAFFEKVGTPFCRERLKNFQRLALKNKKTLLQMFETYAAEKKYEYAIGLEKAFEYIVLEYPFSFWQYKTVDCQAIPQEGASIEEIFKHLEDVVSFSFYSDTSMNSPSMYQFFTQLGYYGYVTGPVKDLLSHSDYPNSAYAPRGVPLVYNPGLMRELNHWLQTKGNNIIYLYGESDPWSASAVELTGHTNALKIFLKGGNHFTFINTFPREQQEKILSTLKKWLGIME